MSRSIRNSIIGGVIPGKELVCLGVVPWLVSTVPSTPQLYRRDIRVAQKHWYLKHALISRNSQ